MRIHVISRKTWPGTNNNILYLQQDNWDDFSYKTTFQAYYQGEFIGTVKIGYIGMEEHQSTFNYIQKDFYQLQKDFFSLWQSEEAYGKIAKINMKCGCNIFDQLNDLALNLECYEKYSEEKSVTISLLRDISPFQCKEQLHRIATGGAILTEYQFAIAIQTNNVPVKLEFNVTPNAKPSSNIHAIIGRNGVGKTNLIKSVACSIAGSPNRQAVLEYKSGESTATFANVLCVSFSPFDDYSSVISLSNNPIEKYPVCSYIGLDRENNDLLGTIENHFLEDLKGCLSSKVKTDRWKKTIQIINSDPMFAEINIGELVTKNDGTEEISAIAKAKECFGVLSSGHKCVLSILTSCVNRLEERSVVLIDEPENHLHPPLLAALIQALSFLLNDRNGVAIISTHSPVVLQEVPQSCVWVINRVGESWHANRPQFETFGADIGSLTREVFGLEVLKSGYHKMIKDIVETSNSLENVLSEFNYNLGNEAIALANILWNQKEREKNND